MKNEIIKGDFPGSSSIDFTRENFVLTYSLLLSRLLLSRLLEHYYE